MATTPDEFDEPTRPTRDWFMSAEELAATRAKIAKLQRRAEAKGFTGTLEVVAEAATRTHTPAIGSLPVVEHGYQVSITGEPPSYGGWRFLASVDMIGTPQPAPITREDDQDAQPYFHRVEEVLLAAGRKRWLVTNPQQPAMFSLDQHLWSVVQVDPAGDTHPVSDHADRAGAQQAADTLDKHLAAGGEPRFKLPDQPAGVVLRFPLGVETRLNASAVRPGECDHCHTARHRSATYLIENDDTGEIKQVGKNCLKDFLGHSTMPVFLDRDSLEERLAISSHQPSAWDLESVLTYAWAVIETHGWRPSGATVATKDLVADVMIGNKRGVELLDSIADKLPEGRAMAARIATELTARLDPAQPYEANLLAIISGGVVDRRKHLGLAVSAINAWRRLDDAPAAPDPEDARNITYAGSVGDKLTLTGTITVVAAVDGYHYNSPERRLLVIDCGEHVAKTITSAAWAYKVERGDTLTVEGTVKAHQDYRGVAQTVLTRPKRVDQAAAVEVPPLHPVWEAVQPTPPHSRFQEAPLAATATPATTGLAI